MSDIYKRAWAEDFQPGTRPTKTRLNCACILIHPHVDNQDRPTPCICACDPVYELRMDFTETFKRAGIR